MVEMEVIGKMACLKWRKWSGGNGVFKLKEIGCMVKMEEMEWSKWWE